jgi:hypothetical protein
VYQLLIIVEASRSHSEITCWVCFLWTSDQLVEETSTWQHTTRTRETDINASGGIRTHNPCKRAAADPRLRLLGNGARLISFAVRSSLLAGRRGKVRRILAVDMVTVNGHKVRSVCTIYAVAAKQYRCVCIRANQTTGPTEAWKPSIDKDRNKAALLAGFRFDLHAMRVRISYSSTS